MHAEQVSEKKAKEWCASKGIPYFETSAKEDINVDAAFLSIAKTALANEHEQDMWVYIFLLHDYKESTILLSLASMQYNAHVARTFLF